MKFGLKRLLGLCLAESTLWAGQGGQAAVHVPDVDGGTVSAASGWTNLGGTISATSNIDNYPYGGMPYADGRDRGEFVFKVTTTNGGTFTVIPHTTIALPDNIYVLNSGEYDENTKTTSHLVADTYSLGTLFGGGTFNHFNAGTYYFVLDSSTTALGSNEPNTNPPSSFDLVYEPFSNVVSFNTTVTTDKIWARPGVESDEVGYTAAYESIPFFVDTAGYYTLITDSAEFDVSKYIFKDAVTSAYAHPNQLAGTGYSADGDISAYLVPGVQYFAVISTFYDAVQNPWSTFEPQEPGDYSGFFTSSDGKVTLGTLAVPEPGTISVLVIGAAWALNTRRRRNK